MNLIKDEVQKRFVIVIITALVSFTSYCGFNLWKVLPNIELVTQSFTNVSDTLTAQLQESNAMLELVGKLTKNSINRIETIKDELPHLSNREIKIPLSEADSLSARAILFQAAALGDLGSLTEYQNITFPNHKQLFNLISKDLKDEATFWIQIAKYARIKSYPNPPDTEELQFQDLGKQMSQMYSTSRSIAASFKALEKSTINIGNDYDKNFSESIKKIRDAKETFTLSILGFFGSIILLISIAYWAISTGIKDTPKADNTIEVKKSENLEIS